MSSITNNYEIYEGKEALNRWHAGAFHEDKLLRITAKVNDIAA